MVVSNVGSASYAEVCLALSSSVSNRLGESLVLGYLLECIALAEDLFTQLKSGQWCLVFSVFDKSLQRQIDEDENFLHRNLENTAQSDIRACSEFVLSWVDMRDVDESALLAGLVAEFSVVVELDAGLCNRIDERAQETGTATRHEIGVGD